MDTVDAVVTYFNTWERYHPEYTPEEKAVFCATLLANLKGEEAKKAYNMIKNLPPGLLTKAYDVALSIRLLS